MVVPKDAVDRAQIREDVEVVRRRVIIIVIIGVIRVVVKVHVVVAAITFVVTVTVTASTVVLVPLCKKKIKKYSPANGRRITWIVD